MRSATAIRVKVVYFGEARDAAGTSEEELSLPGGTSVAALLGAAAKAHGRLSMIRGTMRIAVNEELAAAADRLEDGDVVALLPPVAGG